MNETQFQLLREAYERLELLSSAENLNEDETWRVTCANAYLLPLVEETEREASHE